MSNQNGGASATDVITYVGVPLTVLGILPILYNTAVTLAALSKIKRMLRKCRLTALTRSDVVNRVIEIELPRYAATPWDRFQHRGEYWSLSLHPSTIPGGSWTTFNWKTHVIGVKTQRIEYADQLRQPQAEIAFDELVCYLLDLGAVPDPQGWRILRTTGQWTPVGCPLMRSPDGQHKALTIAPANDSDGNLSLAVSWSEDWIVRSPTSLPPYWVRLYPPPPAKETPKETANEASSSTAAAETEMMPDGDPSEADLEKGACSKSLGTKKSFDSVDRAAASAEKAIISCQINSSGLVTALTAEAVGPSESTHFNSLYIEHLRVRTLSSSVPPPAYASTVTFPPPSMVQPSASSALPNAGTWFASAITAFGTSSQTVLWSYTIPQQILSFARASTMPCGVLVQLGLVDMKDTPQWATDHDDIGADHDLFVKRSREQHHAMQTESRMPPAQRAAAQRERLQREAEQRLQDMKDKMRRERGREETRLVEAIQSPRWANDRVAEYALKWLKGREVVAKSLGLKDAVGSVVLHRMVLDGEFAKELGEMLEVWRSWGENGGMRKADYQILVEKKEVFALAALVVSLVAETAGALEGTLAADLTDCLALWKKVRLG